MAEYLTLRRYYLNKRSAAALRQDSTLEAHWQGKQLAEAGQGLPAHFPSREALSASGYTAQEDLEGADVDELVKYAGLSTRDAEKVIAAYAAL